MTCYAWVDPQLRKKCGRPGHKTIFLILLFIILLPPGCYYKMMSYWYYNLIFLPKSLNDFATDILLMIDSSIAINDWSIINGYYLYVIIALERRERWPHTRFYFDPSSSSSFDILSNVPLEPDGQGCMRMQFILDDLVILVWLLDVLWLLLWIGCYQL